MAEMVSDDAVFTKLLSVFTLLVPEGLDNHAAAVAQRKIQSRIVDTLTGKILVSNCALESKASVIIVGDLGQSLLKSLEYLP